MKQSSDGILVGYLCADQEERSRRLQADPRVLAAYRSRSVATRKGQVWSDDLAREGGLGTGSDRQPLRHCRSVKSGVEALTAAGTAFMGAATAHKYHG